MQINLVWDAAALAAPQSFRDAITIAAKYYSATFTDPITVNISVGYGDVTVNGSVVDHPASGDGEGGPVTGGSYAYGDVAAYLPAAVDPGVVGALDVLPSGAINGQTMVNVWSAEEKALGLIPGDDSAIDGAIGFGAGVPNYSLLPVALHEIAHAVGRTTDNDDTTPSVFDLYRFTAPGQHLVGESDTGVSGYFSLDNGVTPLASYNEAASPADFLGNIAQSVHDPFDWYYDNNTLQYFTSLDLLQMEALGFHVAMAIPAQGVGFLGAGSAGIAFRDAGTGDWGIMSPTATGEAWHGVGPTSTDYAPIAAGDFNGDGFTDIAFRNAQTGDWGFMSANSVTGETWHSVGPSSTAYSVVAAGDFNHDGAMDLAFRNSATGDLGYMSVNPGGGQTWHTVGPTSANYEAVGAADFNGDGVMDIAFYNSATRDWGFMSINPGGGETWHELGSLGSFTDLPNGYQVMGIGDFNGDGVPDIALRSDYNGNWGFFTPDKPGNPANDLIFSWRIVGTASTDYVPVSIGDFDGDGRSDIAFRDVDTGALGYMSVQGFDSFNQYNLHEVWHSMGPTSTDYFAL